MEPRHRYTEEQVREWAFFELRGLGLAHDHERYTLSLASVETRLKGHPEEKRISNQIFQLRATWEPEGELYSAFDNYTTDYSEGKRFNPDTDEWE